MGHEMSAELRTRDGHLVFADQDDGNSVVYLITPSGLRPIWDAWSWQASTGLTFPEPAPGPIGVPPLPPVGPAVGTGVSGQVIRVTADSDRPRPVGMAYWPVINNHAGQAMLRVLVSLADALTLFYVDKASGVVSRGETLPLPPNTGEFCYWSFSDPDLFYFPSGNVLFSYHVVTGELREVVTAPVPITQCHSSADGRSHSCTMDGGAAVSREGRITTYPSAGSYDECQIDKSGEWLLIKEGADNRVVHLSSGRMWTITDKGLAVGHSDMGWGYMVGEDDQTNPGGVFRRWRFTEQGPVDEGVVYAWGGWAPMTRYVSHCNARPGQADGQRVLFSDSAHGLVAKTMGRDDAWMIAPSLTDLNASGGGERYWKHTRATLDPTGEWACWSGNDGTDHMVIFLVRL
jgi:hypothetical protein